MCSSQSILVLPKKLLDIFQEEHPEAVTARQLFCAAQAQSSLGRIDLKNFGWATQTIVLIGMGSAASAAKLCQCCPVHGQFCKRSAWRRTLPSNCFMPQRRG